MVPLTIETEIQSEGLVQVRVPDGLPGRRVKVTVEEVPNSNQERVFGRLEELVEITLSFKGPISGFE